MSDTFQRVVALVARGEVQVSEHGYDELAADGILVKDVVRGLSRGEVVEDYPDFPKGPCVLVLQADRGGRPVHAVWGIPKGASGPAVLVTAYLPAQDRWTADFRRRRA
jgi:hypothetical protein